MTCLVVEGSSCALDLVCVVLPCPVIGSRLLAAACAGGLQPGLNHSTQCHMVSFQPCQAMPYYVTLHSCVTEYASSNLDNVPSLVHFSRFQLNNVGSEGGNDRRLKYEIWKKQPFSALIPAAISGVLSCLFVHYLCIIRQTIIPLCFASVVQMLTGNESPQRPVKGRCYYQSAIHSQPNRDESITFKKSSTERERIFFFLSAAQGKTLPFYEEPEDFFFFLK